MREDRDNLLDVVYFVRFGAEKLPTDIGLRNQFLDELRVYRQAIASQGRSTLSSAAIRGWLSASKPAIPKRASAMAFIYGYLKWIDDTKRQDLSAETLDIRERKAEYENLLAFLKPFDLSLGESVIPISKHAGLRQALPDELRLDKPLVSRVRRILTSAVSNRKRSDTHDLFEGGSRSSQEDVSYYLIYRYSTNFGNIMKSFLVLERPTAEVRSFASFCHFSRGLVRSNESLEKRIFRECEGIILPFERSFYLIGYNYNVRAKANVSRTTYRELRQRARQHPDGLGTISIEYESVDKSNSLISGLIMTMAGDNQPVVSRIALLHLGTKSAIGRSIWDHEIVPWEGPIADAGEDLEKTFERLNEGIHDGRASTVWSSNVERLKSGKELIELIKPMIDNMPDWESASHNPDPSNISKKVGARGALESYGLNRPRD